MALRSDDDQAILYLCRATLAAGKAQVPKGTIDKDDLSWVRRVAYCKDVWRTPPFRSDVRANAGLDPVGSQREAVLLSGFMMHMAATVPDRGGKGHSKPQTALDIALAIKRILKRLGAPLGILPEVQATFKGLVKQYIALRGHEVLQPERKKPLTGATLQSILYLPNGVKIGRRTLDWEDPFFVVFKVVLCTGLSKGMRLASA